MTSLLLIGGGGHCRAAIDVIELQGQFVIKGIVQPSADGTAPVLGYPILGDDEDLPALLADTRQALITVGQIKTPAIRQRLFERLSSLHAIMPCIASPRAHVSRHAEVGHGTLIMHGAVVNARARLGVNGIVNSLSLVEHDAVVGDHCHISTGARVNGGVTIEDGCFIGSGAVLREGVRIGANSVIGAGCIVKRDVPAQSVVKA
ncbi:MAG TPA: acetyltransferase [Steroidobacteraceae bacterium]|nr:acetyltransferase [Steroidobacteraceae bacterium]